METREYDLNSYKLHILKSDKVKSCHLEVHFRDKVDKENIFYKSMLTDILTDGSRELPTRKDVVIKLEELYKASFYGTTTKLGGVINNIFVYDFINPEFIKEKDYLDNVLSLPFEMIMNPKINNKAFDAKMFEIVKTRAKRDILSLNENAVKLSISKALEALDKNSLTNVSVLGTLEDMEKANPEDLYKEYNNMIKNSLCDIFVIGDVDFDEIYKIITSKFKLNTIKSKKLDLYVENKIVKKPIVKSEKGEFVQSNLNVVCNLDNLSLLERNTIIQVYNYILGSGGLTSKLYQKIREENSLCYGVYSLFLKYDNLLLIEVSLDETNKKKAISLIKECLKEMEKGQIKDEEFEDAKLNLLMSLKMAKDNNVSLLSNYIFNKVDNLPSIDERIESIKNVTIKDIVVLAKKVKINTIYTLESKGDK